MGKAQKTNGASFWMGKVIRTSDAYKTKIVDNILGIDLDEKKNKKKAEVIMSKIRVILSAYEGAIQSIDKKPRPANYLAELNGTKKNKDGTLKDGLRRQVFDLSESISNMSYWMKDEFKEQGYNLHEFHRQLAGFFSVCNKIREKYEDLPSAGKPKNTAMRVIVNCLNDVFEKYYSIESLDEDHEENDKRRAPRENARLNFLKACLKLGKIPLPETDSGLIALCYSTDTPPQEKVNITTC